MGADESMEEIEVKDHVQPPLSNFVFSIDGFKVVKTLKETELGKIQRIFDPSEEKYYIAKVIKIDLSNYTNTFLFLNEIQNISKQANPTILPFLGFVMKNKLADDYPTLIYHDFSSENTLTKILELEEKGNAGDLWDNTAKFITACGIISAASYLHKRNFIHGSICTDNIVFGEDYWPYLADFSFTKFFDPDQAKNIKPEIPEIWRAPELAGPYEMSKKGDAFSLSMVLFQMFSGKTTASILEQAPDMDKRIKMNNRPKMGDEFPEIVKKTIHNSWAPNPKDRWSAEYMLHLVDNESINDQIFDDSRIQEFKSECQRKVTIMRKAQDALDLAESGDPVAQSNYGTILKSGQGAPKNLKGSVRYFKMSANQKCPEGMLNYAIALENGSGVKQNIKEALKYFKSAADLGNKNAQHTYAQMLMKGNGTPKNPEEAARYYQLAAQQDHGPANYRLGLIYEFGDGAEKNFALAVKYYRAAALLKFPPAMYKYGSFIVSGKIHDCQTVEGLKNVVEAAQQGYPRAYCFLGALTYSGEGAKQNTTQARKQFLKGLERGEPAGEFGLAIADLIEGKLEGLNHLKKSAEGGYSDAERVYSHFVTDEKHKKELIESSKQGGIQKEVVIPLKIILANTNIEPTVDGVVKAFIALIKKTKKEQKAKKNSAPNPEAEKEKEKV